MIHPKIDDLLEHVDSKYALAIAAAKRARQINDYHHQLGEGSFEQVVPPLVESRSKNFLTMALEEIADRLRIARAEMDAAGQFDHVVTNDAVDRASAELIETIRASLKEKGPT